MKCPHCGRPLEHGLFVCAVCDADATGRMRLEARQEKSAQCWASPPLEPQKGRCQKCGDNIPNYPNMNGSGYRSQSYTENPFTGAVFWLELCRECYLVDFSHVYPDQPLPQI